jgi:hypothetical protein
VRYQILATLSVIGIGALLAACGGSTPVTATASGISADTTTGATAGESALIDSADITPILGTTVLRVGTQRVAFLLEGRTALVTEPTVEVMATAADGTVGDSATATFHLWPFGTRGTYVAEMTFAEPGDWQLSITGSQINGTAVLPVEIAAETGVKDIGERAPFSNTKTLEDAAGDLSKISTHQRPDPDLYEFSIAESLFSGRPSVIVFASPAFCTSPTCGPEVDTIVELKDAHKGEADFIHVEIYDNPHEIQGDLTKAIFSPHVAAWGIDQTPDYRNESWVFVLGTDGKITHRFQGYATLGELEEALIEASS